MAEASSGTNVASFDSPSPDGIFRSKPVFNCSNETFGKCLKGKKKYKKWKAFIQNDEFTTRIQEWRGSSYKNKNANFIIKNSMSGEMIMARQTP